MYEGMLEQMKKAQAKEKDQGFFDLQGKLRNPSLVASSTWKVQSIPGSGLPSGNSLAPGPGVSMKKAVKAPIYVSNLDFDYSESSVSETEDNDQ